MRLLVGMSGASGAVYGVRLLEVLQDLPEVETHLVTTPAARETIRLETGRDPREVDELADVVHRYGDIAAGPSSGSFRLDAMVVVPCSMKTLAAIAYSLSDNLLVRAADVALKERRPLIVAPRENAAPPRPPPLARPARRAEASVIVAPPILAFPRRPESGRRDRRPDGQPAARPARHLELPEDLFRRWRGAHATESREQREGNGDGAG